MRTSRPLIALGAALSLSLSLLALTGCSIKVVDDAKPAASPSGAKSTPGTPSPSVPSPSSAPSTAPSADPATAPQEGGITREQLIAGATTVQRCDGTLTITQDATAIRVEGPCDALYINARAAQIVTDDVTELQIIGDGNLVLTGAVKTLAVNGSANTVKWKGATPSVSDIGAANTLTAG